MINQLTEKVESVQNANSVYSGGVQDACHQKNKSKTKSQNGVLIPDPAKTNENLAKEQSSQIGNSANLPKPARI